MNMATANYLPEVLETSEAERLATGFIFTEGPLWHPDGWWYFVDLRRNQLLRLTPGKEPELVRTTIGGNGTTFDLQGRLVVCEGDDRRLTRMGPDGKVASLVDNYKGGRFNRPNDVICHSNGCLYFTDPDKRRPYHEREIPGPAGEDIEAHPRVLADPAPSVLLDHSADDSAIEIVLVFYTAENQIAALKSDLIKAVHTAFDAKPEKRPQAEQQRRGTRGLS